MATNTWPMSALGHKRTYAVQKAMSALPSIADIRGYDRNVRFVPIADMAASPHRASECARSAFDF
jgi:hypothetical protein